MARRSPRRARDLAAAALFAIGLLGGCTSDPFGCGMGAACPALADVSGERYGVSGAYDLVVIEPDLVPYAEITRTNVTDFFAEMTAYAITGVDPKVLLIARNRVSPEEPEPYRELWSVADDPFPVVFCAYMTPAQRSAQPECPAP